MVTTMGFMQVLQFLHTEHLNTSGVLVSCYNFHSIVKQSLNFSYRISLLGFQSAAVSVIVATPLPAASTISRCNVVGAWNEAKAATHMPLSKPNTSQLLTSLRMNGTPEDKHKHQIINYQMYSKIIKNTDELSGAQRH